MNALRNLLLPAMLAIGTHAAHAQSVVAGGGGHHADTNTTISYTIGEPVTATVASEGNILTQGFQQPWADVSTIIGEAYHNASGIMVYPNPVRHVLHIAMEMPADDQRYTLHDAMGRLIIEGRITGAITDLDLDRQASGGYLLRVSDGASFDRAFKISVTH